MSVYITSAFLWLVIVASSSFCSSSLLPNSGDPRIRPRVGFVCSFAFLNGKYIFKKFIVVYMRIAILEA
jgi:hypothetical protein